MRLERNRANQNGFTLIEVVVALAVVALLLAIIMPAALNAKNRLIDAQDRERAVPLAAALIAERQAGPLNLEDAAGRSGRLAWHTRETIIMTDPRGFFVLTRIETDIRRSDGKLLYDVSTRRLKEVPRV